MRTQDEKLRELIAEEAAEWHVAHAEGGLRPHQARAFMHWLRTSPVHVAEYLAIAEVARGAGEAARQSTTPIPDLESGEETPVRSLHGDHATSIDGISSPHMHRVLSPRGSRQAARRPRTRWVAVAAGILIVSLATLAGAYWLGSNTRVQTFATGHGEERSLQLPDNTLVQLDSDSAITIRFNEGQRLVVVDRGQAFFKVFKDPARPFGVQVGDSLIRDIGTAFNVYQRTDDTTVTVAEGRVQIWREPSGQSAGRWWSWPRSSRDASGPPVADLTAGEQVRIADSGKVTSLGTVDVQQAVAWTHGRIAFDNEAVARVAAEFNRYNNVQISMEGASVGALPISGTFNVHDVNTFVAFLGTLPHVHVEKHGDHIFVGVDREKK